MQALYEKAGGKRKGGKHYSICKICGKIIQTEIYDTDSEMYQHAKHHKVEGKVTIKRRVSTMYTNSIANTFYLNENILPIDDETIRLTKTSIQEGM